MGDEELAEGSVWEAVMAGHHSQSVCPYRSYRQGARQAAAALCPLRRACLTGIGLRIYGNAVSAQRISVNLGAAPCSQCSQGSAAR